MYNQLLKEKFLKNVTKNKSEKYLLIFEEIQSIEDKLGKDIYNFTYDELRRLNLIQNINKVQLLYDYVQWTINQGYAMTNINQFLLFILDGEE